MQSKSKSLTSAFAKMLNSTQLRRTSTQTRSKINWDALPLDIQQTALTLEHARRHNYQIPPLSKSQPELDQETGYRITAAIRTLRQQMNEEVVVGRKIGFTNRGIWPEYGIDASNWSYMYRNTVLDLNELGPVEERQEVELDISHLSQMEPRIEPEIVLGLAAVPTPSMSDEEILRCIEWIAHGFEIVASVFPNWKFTAADTTAAFALHGTLAVGPKRYIRDINHSSKELLSQLADFKIVLSRNGEQADEGKGSNVLGSPVKALRHLVELLEVDEINDPLSIEETVTTGTLTKALPINDGDTWSTELEGIDLPGLQVKFRFQ